MTDLTQANLNALTEILTGAPATRVATKAKAVERFETAAISSGKSAKDVRMILNLDFPTAKAVVLRATEPAESEMLKRAEAVTGKGIGGAGLARLRNHPEYEKITGQTKKEAAAVITGENPFDKKKKPHQAAKPAAKAKPETPKKASRSKIEPTDVIHAIKENPKRENTKAHSIYACYNSLMTVEKFIAAVKRKGFTEADARSNLAWDRKKEFISIRKASS